MTSTIANDQPEAALADMLETRDGFQIRFAVFKATAKPAKGTTMLLHGRNECTEKYHETIWDLMERGFDVVTFDWRGQGRSSRFLRDGRRGYVDHFDQYLGDLDQVFTEVALPECRPPFFILAHSTGALIALLAAPALVNRVHRIVLTNPFLSLHDTRVSTANMNLLSRAACFAGLGTMYAAGGPKGSRRLTFETNLLTTDRERFTRNQALLDPENGLGLGGPTTAWILAATNAIAQVEDPDHMAQIHIPTLIIAGGADRLVSAKSIEDFAARMRSGSLIIIDGARHEILQEADFYREQFFAAFEAFVPGSGTPG